MNKQKLGLANVVSISVGLVVATSCLVSLGEGSGTLGVTFILAMAIAMLLNMTTVASLSELNALMPNTTGGLAQYTLAALGPLPTLVSMVGGYIICNTMSCGVEASIFFIFTCRYNWWKCAEYSLYIYNDSYNSSCKLTWS